MPRSPLPLHLHVGLKCVAIVFILQYQKRHPTHPPQKTLSEERKERIGPSNFSIAMTQHQWRWLWRCLNKGVQVAKSLVLAINWNCSPTVILSYKLDKPHTWKRNDKSVHVKWRVMQVLDPSLTDISDCYTMLLLWDNGHIHNYNIWILATGWKKNYQGTQVYKV